ncbi:cytochrome P450 [Pseudonocardia eucalypti]|uniref:Cytochrome P450 n=1 Tax=Pseudonocardia eucalypti TaxID=648755 RepID=A0ABP9Q054_9PSEU|nr:cytochrome P450 [Pseudonocardia eucalypti]
MSEPTLTLVQFLRNGLDPVPELGQLRAERPVSPLVIPNGPTAWLVTGYSETRAVLGDADRFSNDFANLANMGGPTEDRDPGGLGMADPPKHTRLRKLLLPEFTAKRLRALEPRITEVVEGCLDDMAAARAADPETPVDLVSTFAQPIPALVISELLGVPDEERDDFQRLSNNRFDLSGALDSGVDAVNESVAYLGGLVARQRAEPGDGLLGRLIREHGDDLTDRELAGLADGLLTGGHDTTASMLALGTLILLREPEQRAAALAPDRVYPLVDELLRYISVVQVAFPRWARREVEIGGQRIGPGDMVICSLSGANRDPFLGSDLERVDPSRTVSSHLAFGYGIHRCVGAELARREMAIAYPALLRRFPELKLAVAEVELTYRPFSIVYAVTSLPVTW